MQINFWEKIKYEAKKNYNTNIYFREILNSNLKQIYKNKTRCLIGKTHMPFGKFYF